MATVNEYQDGLDGKTALSHEEVMHLGALTDEEVVIEKKLKRRIDFLIMPLVILVYVMNYIDRNNYAAAKLQGLVEDLHLVGDQYQTALSLFYIGYILGQVPSNLLLNYAGRPSLYLGFFIIAWGLTSACTSQVTGFGGIVACRMILGFVEAPFFSGVLFYLSKWYTRRELNFRMSIFYSGSLISGAFGSLIAAGILKGLAGKRGMAAWQWLYIIEGSITVFAGLVVCFALPDFPDTWRLLSPAEKTVATRRLALDAANVDVDEAGSMSQLKGLKLALTDVKTYLFALAYLGMTTAVGFQNFFPTLTSTLGYSHIISLLLVAPPYIFMTFYSYIHSIISDRLKTRFWFYMYPIPISIVGFAIFMSVESFGPKYFSFFLMIFVFAMNGTIFSWIASSLPRPPAKRAAAFAFINAIGNSASIWTPFTLIPGEAPYYRTFFGIAIGAQIIAAISGLLIRSVLTRQNKELERLDNEDVELTECELARLTVTAEIEGIDIAAARALQKGYRYMI